MTPRDIWVERAISFAIGLGFVALCALVIAP